MSKIDIKVIPAKLDNMNLEWECPRCKHTNKTGVSRKYIQSQKKRLLVQCGHCLKNSVAKRELNGWLKD